MTPSINGWYKPSSEDSDSWLEIRDIHFEFIKKATKKCTTFSSASQGTHSPELLEYLRRELGESVPSPNYENKIDVPALKNDVDINKPLNESNKTVAANLDKSRKSNNNGIKKTQEKSNLQISEKEFNKNYEKDLERVSKLSPENLLKRIKSLPKTRDPIEVVSIRRPRNAVVVEFTLKRANGVCQLCGNPSPFTKKDGTPYLEVHHIQWLSEDGFDTPENTVALCPNCHRKMHILNLENDKNFLFNLIT
jgi:hypothetical protein